MMQITKNTTVSQLREKFADYTILRVLAAKLHEKRSAFDLAKKAGSAYKAARLLLEKYQRAHKGTSKLAV